MAVGSARRDNATTIGQPELHDRTDGDAKRLGGFRRSRDRYEQQYAAMFLSKGIQGADKVTLL